MFISATKAAIVESLRSIWFVDGNEEAHVYRQELTENDKPIPRRVTIEYPEEAQNWPFILVQIRPTIIRWTGINPDEIVNVGTDGTPQYQLIRQGFFEATCMLQIMALSSLERDRMWDNLIKIIMMGRKRTVTNNFYKTLATHELIGLTISEGNIEPVGDTISQGTPWDDELLSYEASIAFEMTGTFYADEYTEDLVPLSEAKVYEYVSFKDNPDPNEASPLPQDVWIDPWNNI